MALSDCAADISRAIGRAVTEIEAAQIMGVVHDRAKIIEAEKGFLSAEERLKLASGQLAEEAKAAAAIEKRNRLLNLKKRVARDQFYKDAPNAQMGLEAKISGVNTPWKGSRLSVDAQARALYGDYLDGLTADLDRAGFTEVVRRGDLDEKWGQELFELSKGEKGNPGVTGSKDALDIAKLVFKYQRLSVETLNREGAWIGEYDGYIARTTHDPDKIRRAGHGLMERRVDEVKAYQKWRDDIAPLLDQDKTFEGVEDVELFLHGVHNALVDGVHLTHDGLTGFKDPAFKGPGNLAKRLAQGRVLHFRDAQSWMAYRAKYGSGAPLIQDIMRSLETASQSTALMREFGTNPRAEFEADLQRLTERLHLAGDTKAVTKLRNARKKLENRFAEVDGSVNMPGNRQAANIASGYRAWISASKLGGVLLSQFGDLMTGAMELRYQGVNLLEAYGTGLNSIVRGRGGKGTVRRDVAELTRAGLDGMRGNILTRFDVTTDTAPGVISRGLNRFFKLAGMTYWTDAQRAGLAQTMARHLGMQRNKAWVNIDPRSRRVLSLFDIGEGEWNMLRQLDWKQADGRNYLTPDAASRLSDEAIDTHLASQVADIKARPGKIKNATEKAPGQAWYHGTRSEFSRFDDIAYLTPEKTEAEAYAEGVHLGGRGDGTPRVLQYQAAPGPVRNIDDALMEAMENGDDLIAAIETEVSKSMAAKDARYIEYTHPSADGEADHLVRISLYPNEDLKRVDAPAPESRATAQRAEAEALVEPRLQRLRDDYRRTLRLKLLSYFTDRVEYGNLSPGARERAILRRGLRPGTVEGEAIRFIAQFKAFPVTLITKTWGRTLYGGMGRPAAVAGAAHMIVGSLILGYLSMTAKDAAKGRNPRDPTDPATWGAAIAQGGGLGIYGDFLLGDFNRNGRTALATLAGPTLSQIDDIAELWSRVRNGDDAAAQRFRFLINNTPYVNLFYTRIALDYLILNQIQEALNPGYLRRMEARVKRENNQTFFLPPSMAGR